MAVKAVMKTAAASSQPHFVQGLLQVDDDLTVVWKGQRDHATRALIVDIGIGVVIQAIAADLYAREQAFSLVQKFKVGHYNRCMLKVIRILITAHALVGGAAMLTACGQKGALVLPSTPESVGRATLPQTLKLWPASPAASPSQAPAASTSGSDKTNPVAVPSGSPTPPLTAPEAPAAAPR